MILHGIALTDTEREEAAATEQERGATCQSAAVVFACACVGLRESTGLHRKFDVGFTLKFRLWNSKQIKTHRDSSGIAITGVLAPDWQGL